MKSDIQNLLADYGINFQTSGHKHTRPGWANMPCPFCSGTPGLHLGLNLAGNYFTCWRCGSKQNNQVIAKLLGLSVSEANELLRNYKTYLPKAKESKTVKPMIKGFKYPSGTSNLGEKHKKYLIKRGFTLDYEIAKTWGILGTGPIALLDKIDYKHRIVIPIIWKNKVVSFQARDVTDKAKRKYMACPMDRELVHHKDIYYAHPDINVDLPIIICEGILDVWKLGKQAICVFGTGYTKKQMLKIRKRFKHGVIIFDNEDAAQKKAKRLWGELSVMRDFRIRVVKDDPGSMDRIEVKELWNKINEMF